jgi:hypothetical protein
VAPGPGVLEAAIAAADPTDRLVQAPTFILSSVRSGSTLLRLILDSHPAICSPHEMHLRQIGVWARGHGEYSIGKLGLAGDQLRYLLWDRLLDRELRRTGKTHFVNKTPTDALMWADILSCWPDARFIFLRRHPAAIVDSWAKARTDLTRDLVGRDIHAYAVGMEQAYEAHGGLVVRYEDLTADPDGETRRICDFVGVPWAPEMVHYGQAPHAGLARGLGDWSPKMHSGVVHAAEPLPPDDRIPEILLPTARAWGYVA